MESSTHLKELTESVSLYNDKRNSFDKRELQDLRDRISLSLFYLSDFYSSCRAASEMAEFTKKLCLAEKEESLRGVKVAETNKAMTREQIINEARITCKDKEEELIEANRKYYKIRMIVETASQILHSIASRLNQIN